MSCSWIICAGNQSGGSISDRFLPLNPFRILHLQHTQTWFPRISPQVPGIHAVEKLWDEPVDVIPAAHLEKVSTSDPDARPLRRLSTAISASPNP